MVDSIQIARHEAIEAGVVEGKVVRLVCADCHPVHDVTWRSLPDGISVQVDRKIRSTAQMRRRRYKTAPDGKLYRIVLNPF